MWVQHAVVSSSFLDQKSSTPVAVVLAEPDEKLGNRGVDAAASLLQA